MSVHFLDASRQDVENILYSTVYDKMTLDERAIMNQFIYVSQDLFVGNYAGEIACVWGLVPPTLLSTRAYLWLYCTPLVDEHKFLFIRQSQLAVEKMLEKYDTIVGHTTAGNELAIRWLKWLGATFSPSDGKKLDFTIRKKHG